MLYYRGGMVEETNIYILYMWQLTNIIYLDNLVLLLLKEYSCRYEQEEFVTDLCYVGRNMKELLIGQQQTLLADYLIDKTFEITDVIPWNVEYNTL